MLTRHRIRFGDTRQALAAQIESEADLDAALAMLGMTPPRRVLVLVGGASGMGQNTSVQIETFLREVVITTAESLSLVLLTGGTDAGIMAMLGRAHSVRQSTAPLIGIAAIGTVFWPGRGPGSDDACVLEPNHTGFVLVPGHAWGDESRWLAEIANRIAGTLSSLTLLINGGEIALKDVECSLAENRPVLALKGSGRKADEFAAGLSGVQQSAAIQQAVATQKVALLDLQANADDNLEILKSFF